MNRFGAPPEHSLNMLLLVRVRPYRDDHWEALKLRFGLEPQTGRMSELGQTATFATLSINAVRIAPTSAQRVASCGKIIGIDL